MPIVMPPSSDFQSSPQEGNLQQGMIGDVDGDLPKNRMEMQTYVANMKSLNKGSSHLDRVTISSAIPQQAQVPSLEGPLIEVPISSMSRPIRMSRVTKPRLKGAHNSALGSKLNMGLVGSLDIPIRALEKNQI